MPKKESKGDFEMTRFDRALLRKARTVANHLDLLLSEYISEAARRKIESDYEKIITEEHRKLADRN